MITIHSYVLYCGLYAIAIAVPGPGVIAIMARALRLGFRATIPAVIATAIGDWSLMSLSAFGLAVLTQSMGNLFLIVRLGGAVYLLFLGYRYWTADVIDSYGDNAAAGRSGFISQFALTIGNPKAIAFFIALLPSAVDLHKLKLAGYVQLSMASFVLIPTITLTYAALADRMRVFITSATTRRRINKTAALIMAGAAIAVAAS
jgi:threonine/homoserine/homoserine lactone efflux protein